MPGADHAHHVDNWYSDICDQENSDNRFHEIETFEMPESPPPLHSPENDAHNRLVITSQRMIDGTFWEYRNNRD